MQLRSGRQSQAQRPSFPIHSTAGSSTSSSAASSLHQSSNSLAPLQYRNSSTQSEFSMAGHQSTNENQQAFFTSAPLPSPSYSTGADAQSSAGYFGVSAASSSQNGRLAVPSGGSVVNSNNNAYAAQRGAAIAPSSHAHETAPFLRDFNLLAEAAKRAQMACLARDLGDVNI